MLLVSLLVPVVNVPRFAVLLIVPPLDLLSTARINVDLMTMLLVHELICVFRLVAEMLTLM